MAIIIVVGETRFKGITRFIIKPMVRELAIIIKFVEKRSIVIAGLRD